MFKVAKNNSQNEPDLADSFEEVTSKRNKRNAKLQDKEKLHEDKVAKKQLEFKEPAPVNKTAEEEDILSSNEEQMSHDQTVGGSVIYSKKKKQYTQEVINDKRGEFNYEDDPNQYKKARKRLQNRESAERSRKKRREEVEKLEEMIKQLNEEKARVESANAELSRQNKYWEDLFAKQQLKTVVPTTVVHAPAGHYPQPQLQQSVSQEANQQGNTGISSMLDFSNSEPDLSELIENSIDPTFSAQRMPSSRGSKRQRRLESSEFGSSSLLDFENSLQIESELLDNECSFEKAIEPDTRSVELQDTVRRQPSISELPMRQTSINLDDCYLQRQPNERGDPRFLGLAIFFGSLAVVGSMSSTTGSELADTGIAGDVASCTSGQSLKSASRLSTEESVPLKYADDSEDIHQVSLDPTSTSQNLMTALRLILQAVKTMHPIFSLISFLFSMILLCLYVMPISRLFESSSGSKAEQLNYNKAVGKGTQAAADGKVRSRRKRSGRSSLGSAPVEVRQSSGRRQRRA